jgi:hypothetical protein
VAIRVILAIPHLLVLSFLGIAALVVVIIGWLGALVTGRLPRFAATYLSGYLRWYSGVGAYLLLLTDQYPPFAFGDSAYPVRLAVGSGKLNRITVLFRVILAIPPAIVSILLTFGFTTIVVFIAWLTALIAGRLPAPLHQAFAAVLRYTIRYYGYLYLLTDAYPAGLLGDEPGDQQEAGAFGQAASWQLALSSGAKRLVGLILVLGLLTAAGAGAFAGATIYAVRQRDREISQLNTAVARFNPVVAAHNAAVAANNAALAREQVAASQVDDANEVVGDAYQTLAGELNSPGADSSNCLTVSCFSVTTAPDVDAFAAFGRTLRATAVPPGSAAIAKRLIAVSAQNEQDYQEIVQAASLTSIENIATAAESDGSQFDNDYTALMASLSSESTALSEQDVTLSNTGASLNNAAMTLNHEATALNRQAAALNVRVSVRAADETTAAADEA